MSNVMHQAGQRPVTLRLNAGHRKAQRGPIVSAARIVAAIVGLALLAAAMWRPLGDAVMLMASNALRLPLGAMMFLALEIFATNLPVIAAIGVLVAVIVINAIRLLRK